MALSVLERYGVNDLGPPRDTFDSDSLESTIRLIEHDVGILAVAVAENDATSYLILVVGEGNPNLGPNVMV